jgi:hypothetical protein
VRGHRKNKTGENSVERFRSAQCPSRLSASLSDVDRIRFVFHG